DLQALVQKGQFAQSLGESVVVEFSGREDALVRQKVNLRPAPFAGACLAQGRSRIAARIVLLIGVAVAPDLDVELLAERIHATDSYAMQTAGNLVSRGIELATCMQLG